jgi:hypothetical protein
MNLPEPGTVIRIPGVAGDRDRTYSILGVDPGVGHCVVARAMAIDGAASSGPEDLRLTPDSFTVVGQHEPIGGGECTSRHEWIAAVRKRAQAVLSTT